tara:strand:+ start:19956 stop:21560 length:1605 start_codon:yes stop_codon:yes gene_type:complete
VSTFGNNNTKGFRKTTGFYWVILLFLISNLTFAQFNSSSFNVQFGPDIRVTKKTIIDHVIGEDAKGVYAITQLNSKVILKYITSDLGRIKENEVKLKLFKQELRYGGAVQMNDAIYIFSTYRDRKEKTTSLYSQKVNKDLLTLSIPKLLKSVSYEGYHSSKSASFEFKTSPDDSLLLFITNLPTVKDKDTRFGFLILDKEMNEVWDNSEIMESDPNSEFYRMDTQVDNDGNVFLLSKITDTSKEYGRNEIDYTFKMRVYKQNTKPKHREYAVFIRGQHVTDIKFELLPGHQTQVVGFYSSDGLGQNGVFNMKYDSNFNLLTEVSKEFPTDFIVQYSSEKERDKVTKKEEKGKGIELYAYHINQLIKNQDLTLTMVAEQYFEYVNSYTDSDGHVKNTVHYVYGDIVVVKFDLNGNVEWMELVPKDQNTSDRGYYSSYAISQLTDGSLVFVFNDNPKNRFADNLNKYYTWTNNKNNTEVVLFDISLEGRMNRYVVFKGMDEDVLCRPSVSLELGDNQMLILGESRTLMKLVKITWE